MKKFCTYIFLLFVCSSLLAAGCGNKGETKFELIRVDHIKVITMPALEAYTYYVSNPTKSAIRQFCEELNKKRLGELKNLNQSLVLTFYDNKAHTPDYTQGYDPSDTPENAYSVALCVINPGPSVTRGRQVYFYEKYMKIPE